MSQDSDSLSTLPRLNEQTK